MAQGNMHGGSSRPQSGANTSASDEQQETSVRVALRARPMLRAEKLSKARECLHFPSTADGSKPCAIIGRNRAFAFDDVFSPHCSQQDVYDSCVAPLVQSCFNGYNATCVCYGQTGSGKTFTMGSGDASAMCDDQDHGILPRVMSDLFKGVDVHKDNAQVTLKCAFLEIHNEEVRDLLHPESDPKSIAIRERGDGAITVTGIKEEVATTYDEMMAALQRGGTLRTTGQTEMNDRSSRSHAIFSIMLQMRSNRHGKRGQASYVTSKFHLVDLAGSERNKKTGTKGERFKESVNINQGLLALGNVINALTDERRRAQHIPYRQSKLTRLLQDSLGGNSRTVMIACVPTVDAHFDETLNTLKYASRARYIRNKPVVNTEPEKAQLAEGQENYSGGVHEEEYDIEEKEALQKAKREAKEEVEKIKSDLAQAMEAKEASQDEALTLRAERDHAKLRVGELCDMMRKTENELYSCHQEGLLSQDVLQRVLQHSGSFTSENDGGTVNREEANTVSQGNVMKGKGHNGDEESVLLKRKLAEKVEELKQTQSSLEEAECDLHRDEEIFAEKCREIERLRMKAESFEQEHHKRQMPEEQRQQSPETRAAAYDTPGSKNNSVEEENSTEHILQDLEDFVTNESRQDSDTKGNSDAEEPETNENVQEAERSLKDVKQLNNKLQYSEAERRKLQRDNDQKEKQRRRLEVALEQKDNEYKRSKNQLEAQLRELERSIKTQEEWISEKEKNEAELRKRSSQYEERLAELEKQVNNKEAECEYLQSQLQEVEQSVQQSDEEKQKMQEHYKEKLKSAEIERDKLKKEHDNEDERLQLTSGPKVSELKKELKRMQQEREAVQRKRRQQDEEQAQARKQLQQQLSQTQALVSKEQNRIRELEVENKRQRKELEEKQKEMASVHKRLKLHGHTTPRSSHSEKTNSRTQKDRSTDGRSSYGVKTLNRPQTAPKRTSSRVDEGVSQEEIQRHSNWIEGNLDALLKEKEAKSEFERASTKQTSLQADKESQMQERQKLELKRQRMHSKFRQTKKRAEEQLRRIESELHELEANVNLGETDRDQRMSDLQEHMRNWQKQKDKAMKYLEEGSFLSEEDESALREIDESIDELETECEYIAGEVAERQRELQENSVAAATFREQLKQIPPVSAQAALAEYVDKAAQWKYEERKEQERVCELEMQLSEQSKRTTELENALKMKEIEYDRRVVDLRKESERRVQKVLRGDIEGTPKTKGGTPDKSESSKSANKERMRKIRELGELTYGTTTGEQNRSQHRPQSSPAKATSRRVDLTSPRTSPWTVNDNTVNVDTSGSTNDAGNQFVQVPRKQLKQVDEEQIARRASAAGLQVPQAHGGEAGAAPHAPTKRSPQQSPQS